MCPFFGICRMYGSLIVAVLQKSLRKGSQMEQGEQGLNVRISVRDLVEFILRSGDIDNRHGGGRMDREAMQEGSRIHRKIQGRMGGSYRAEVLLAVTVPGDGYTLTVEGRADGIFCEEIGVWEKWQTKGLEKLERVHTATSVKEIGESKNADAAAIPGKDSAADSITGNEKDDAAAISRKDDAADGISGDEAALSGKEDGVSAEESAAWVLSGIDEIKTMYRDVATLEQPYSVHLAQAKCYAHIYAAKNGLAGVGVQMTYCNQETEEIRRFREYFTAEELQEWFTELIDQYRKWAEYQREWLAVRQASIKTLEFPFAWRDGQKKVAQDVYRTILRRKKLFLQAPTGTGKTLSTVFPAVKAMGEGLVERIFFATAKTIARTVAEESFRILRERGMRLKTLTITAKEKICPCEETNCNPEDCPFARGHFDRVNDAVFELITSGEAFDRAAILQQAQKWQVCPFEMSLDVSLWSDAVICDYNYLFDPRAKLKRFFSENGKREYVFLVDEAHNLVDRGREMFSASLYKEDFLAVKKEVQAHSKKLTRALGRCNTWLLEQKREYEGLHVYPDIGTFPVYLMNLAGVMEEFLEDSHDYARNQVVLELYFQVRTFLEVCGNLDETYVIYSELTEDGRFLVRLYCVDISKQLQECLDKGRSTVFFSATLLPIQYYKRLLSTEKDNYAIYAQPVFDPEKRLVLVGTDTSSRYVNRTMQEYQKMAQYVLYAVRAKRGNYLVFFSSYRMLEEVAEAFEGLLAQEGEQIEVIRQVPGMTEQQREAFLLQFEQEHPEGLAGFCVMGGIFSEGIDLRADRLIGAVIIGPGLPQVCPERELLKNYYDDRGEDGFFYAYLCPGMNKVLQSAGRVIRTDEDEGTILLLDERFARRTYQELFPAEWAVPPACTLATVRKHLDEFWGERKVKFAIHTNVGRES